MKWRNTPFTFKSVFRNFHREWKGTVAKLLFMMIPLGLIAGLWAMNRETTEGSLRYLKSLPTTHWISQRGAVSLVSNSFVEPNLLRQLRLAGYAADGTLVYYNQVNDRDATFQSYTPGGILSPKLKAGRQVGDEHEVVLDHILAKHLGVKIGDHVRMVNDQFLVVGLSKASNSPAKEIVFITQQAMFNLIGAPAYQVLAVQVRSNQSWPPPGISLAGYHWVTQKQFLASNLHYWESSFGSFFYVPLVCVFGGLLAIMVISLRREFLARVGVLAKLRAFGATRRQLITSEVLELLCIGVVAIVFGTLVAKGLTFFANNTIPGMTASITAEDVLLASVCAAVVSLIALVSPIQQMRRLSPVEAMRATY